MKKIRQNLKPFVFMLVLLVMICYPVYSTENYHAATSYTNAKEFYNSTALKNEPYHAEMINGSILLCHQCQACSFQYKPKIPYHRI